MSLVAQRDALTAALSTVDGVQGFRVMPAAPRAGDGWPVMGRGERAAGSAFTVAWRVRVCVPGNDELAALEAFDAMWPSLFFALLEAGAEPDAFAPVIISTKQGDFWAYEIICRTGE